MTSYINSLSEIRKRIIRRLKIPNILLSNNKYFNQKYSAVVKKNFSSQKMRTLEKNIIMIIIWNTV